jgi:SAM-dependent methyltransferase
VRYDAVRLPPPDIYEQEYALWPWGLLINKVCEKIINTAPPGGFVLDYMCGTGYVLNAIAERRADLALEGCSLDRTYLEYGRRKYPGLSLVYEDVFRFTPSMSPDVVVCTGGIHHLDRTSQGLFVSKIASELQAGKLLIVGEEVIRPWRDESQRLQSVTELGASLVTYVASQNAPASVIEAAVDMLRNDVLGVEFKLSLAELVELLTQHFFIEEVQNFWPSGVQEYGDVALTCRRR